MRVFAPVSLVVSVGGSRDADDLHLLQSVAAARKHEVKLTSFDRISQLLHESKQSHEACMQVLIGEEAPMEGTFIGSDNHKVDVSVGDVAATPGSFCVPTASLALMERSFGLSSAGDFEAAVASKKKVDGTIGGKRRKKTYAGSKPAKRYEGYTVIGDGACATSDVDARSSGAYTCLDNAHDGCAGDETPVDSGDGLLVCPGPDGEVNTADDTYLECSETDDTQDDCVAACTAKSGCNGVEYKVASHTGKSVCELHFTSIDGWKDSVWFNRKDDGSFAVNPDGVGFRKGKPCDDCAAEISLPVKDLAACEAECLKNAACRGIEFENPQSGVGQGDCEVQFDEFSHYVKGACYKKNPPVKQYTGYTVIGDGACATSDVDSRSSGAYTCLDNAHDGCAGDEPAVDSGGGLFVCPGPDGEVNTADDTYLECSETDDTQDDCIAACTAKSGCNGVEYKVASHTGKSVCELHFTSIDGWKDSVWFNRKVDGSFAVNPDGVGFRKGKSCDDCAAEISLPVKDLAGCRQECEKYPACRGIEFENPQSGVGQGDCEVQFEEFSHYVKGACYQKMQEP